MFILCVRVCVCSGECSYFALGEDESERKGKQKKKKRQEQRTEWEGSYRFRKSELRSTEKAPLQNAQFKHKITSAYFHWDCFEKLGIVNQIYINQILNFTACGSCNQFNPALQVHNLKYNNICSLHIESVKYGLSRALRPLFMRYSLNENWCSAGLWWSFEGTETEA